MSNESISHSKQPLLEAATEDVPYSGGFSKLQQSAEHVMVVSFFIETNNNELLRKNHMHTQNCKGRNIDSWTACMLTNCFAIQKFNKQLLNPVLTFERVGNLHYSREGLNNIYFTEVSSIYLVLNLQKV